ncbi:MAG: hypothetical protein FVQ84_07300 [Planctomycetes bacterium]|nr:hypothetical protein [Planctomycetota bacterium]
MLDKKAGVVFLPTTPRCGNVNTINNTKGYVTQSSENLREQLGLLLYHLQNPLKQPQRRMNWLLFGVVLRQDYDVKTSGGLNDD